MLRVFLTCAVTGLGVFGPATPSVSAYVVSVESEFGDTFDVAPGQTFDVSIVLTDAGGALEHNAAILFVNFLLDEGSGLGVVLEGAVWAAPYETGTFTEDSTPLSGDLPQELTPDLFVRPGAAEGLTDIELSNVLLSGSFTSGTIVTLALSVLEGAAFGSEIVITAEADTISLGFDEIGTESGFGVIARVVPGPAGMRLFAISGVMCLGRRRSGRGGA